MLNIKFIRENPSKTAKAAKDKGINVDIDHIIKIDSKYRELSQIVQNLREERNIAAKSQNIEEGKRLKIELEREENAQKAVEEELKQWLLKVPNPAKDDLKVGKNEGGLLEFALGQFALETLIKEGFTPVVPPVLLKTEVMKGLGYMENGGDEDMFHIEKDGFTLVGTAEHAIVPMHRDETFSAKELPRRYVGFSTAFRREAGSYGKDTRGILRVHQFDKVEMVVFTKPEDEEKIHKEMLAMSEELMKELGLPFQVVKMCTADLGFPVSRKYDLEAWIPSEDRYREGTSTSTTGNFQSRRLNIKVKGQN